MKDTSPSVNLLEWNESFSVGVTEIDEQHQALFRMINHLQRASRYGSGGSTVGSMLRDLAEYAQEHFQTEERHMARVNYPDVAAHKAEHERFKREVLKFQDAFFKYDALLSIEILAFARDWVIDHVLTVDVKLKPYLTEDAATSVGGSGG